MDNTKRRGHNALRFVLAKGRFLRVRYAPAPIRRVASWRSQLKVSADVILASAGRGLDSLALRAW